MIGQRIIPPIPPGKKGRKKIKKEGRVVAGYQGSRVAGYQGSMIAGVQKEARAMGSLQKQNVQYQGFARGHPPYY